MVIIQFNRELSIGSGGNQPVILRPGCEYVFAQDQYQYIKLFAEDAIASIRPLREDYCKYSGEDLAGKTLLAWRSGGIGDLLFMTPVFNYLKKTYPDCKIILATQSKYFTLFKGSNLVDETLPIPFSVEDLHRCNYHLHFEGIIENNPRAEKINAYDLFVEWFNLRGKIPPRVPEMLPIANFPPELDVRAKETLMHIDPKMSVRIGLHIATSSPIRNWPLPNQRMFAKMAVEKGWKVFLFGSTYDTDLTKMFDLKGVYNLIPNTSNDIQKIMSFINNMNVMVGPDSSMIHLAAALNVPAVGLYGPFKSFLRCKYYSKFICLDSEIQCQPFLGVHHCFKHGYEPCKISSQTGESPCMALILPEMVIQSAEELLQLYGPTAVEKKDP